MDRKLMIDNNTLPQDIATDNQRRAADPRVSAWVEANAGSGKTKVLIDRMLNLLLMGVEPHRILCLTFTKAVAAQMHNRLIDVLKQWSTMSEDKLIASITTLQGRQPTADQKDLARTLFATVLESPGGIKIQTIHAFCQSVLGQFPLEAKIPPNFQLLSEATTNKLALESLKNLLLTTQAVEKESVDVVMQSISDLRLDEFVKVLLSVRGKYADIWRSYPDIAAIKQKIQQQLNLKYSTAQEIIADINNEIAQKQDKLKETIEIFLASASSTETDSAEKLAPYLAAEKNITVETWPDFKLFMFTTKNEVDKRLPTKKTAAGYPWISDFWQQLAERLSIFDDQLRALKLAEFSFHMSIFAKAFYQRFAAVKQQHMGLDFDDLIYQTKNLLLHEPGAQWILYKLDGGIDHILIDEAQDTSPDQWDIIQALADDFFSGDSRAKRSRTLFAVGDIKQSIYGFQGADPSKFKTVEKYFRQKVANAEKTWRDVIFNVSFRSTSAVLDVVDQVFADATVAGVYDIDTHHLANRSDMPGHVEIWPLVQQPEQEQIKVWQLPGQKRLLPSAETSVAELIAHRIHDWLQSGEVLPSTGKPIEPRDILILVRRRTNIFSNALISRLKNLNVPVAGVDRLNLTAELVIEDLLALGEFALLPIDDLTLAVVLKSPFIGMNDDDLLSLAYNRAGPLWDRLQQSQLPIAKKAVAFLQDVITLSQEKSVYDFYADILIRLEGRKKLQSRLGEQINDPINAFLTEALNFTASGTASLQQFVFDMRKLAQDIKRDAEDAKVNQVRLMTVHGAKGLEAPIVILADTTSLPDKKIDVLDSKDMLYWIGAKDEDPKAVKPLRDQKLQQQIEEYNRLLYVAMTRAADKLYITGWQGGRDVNDAAWYKKVEKALKTMGAATVFAPANDYNKAWARHWQGESFYHQSGKTLMSKQRDTIPTPSIQLPSWAKRPVKHEVSEKKLSSKIDKGSDQERIKGTLIHHYFEYYDRLKNQNVHDVLQKMCAKYYPTMAHAECEAAAKNIAAMVEDKDVSALLDLPALTEVPVIAKDLGNKRVDRVATHGNKLIVMDIKTGTLSGAFKDAAISQVKDYQSLLKRAFPDKEVEGYILQTKSPYVIVVK